MPHLKLFHSENDYSLRSCAHLVRTQGGYSIIDAKTYFESFFNRMLALGLSAWEMIETQDFREPKLELPLLVQFLPSLMSLIVDDQVRSLNSKFPVEDRDTASIIIDHSGKHNIHGIFLQVGKYSISIF